MKTIEIKNETLNPPTYLINNQYRITIYSVSLVRVEFSKKGLFEDENPLIIEPSFSEPVIHKINQTNGCVNLSTKYFKLILIPNGQPIDIGNFYFKVKSTGYCWTPGKVDDKNLGGAFTDLYKYPEGKSGERFSDGLISQNGFFIFRNICEYLWDKKTGWIKKKQDWEAQDWYIFGYGRDYKKAFLDFITLFGKIPIPPKWIFGYWYSKWYKFKDTEILDLIKKIRGLNIPLDVFVIDTDWRKHSWNGYEWNREFFPEPQKFISELKSQNVHCCLNDHPGYGSSDELPQDDPFKEKIKMQIPDIKEYRIKWNDRRYVNTWMEEIFIKFLQDGIDFWWVDGWGATDGIMDLSSQLWLNRFYFEACKKTGDTRRPLILSRWGGIGSHKYPVQFSGDTHSSFETIKYQIEFTHKGGNLGATYWSHDIGGFLGSKISDELFIRWLQFGCFSPIMRTHSSGGDREVWNYSSEVLEIFKKYVRIRYSLFPYFYTLARECFDTGLPIIRGLYIEFPSDNQSYLNNEEYLIGKNLLIAPAYGPGKVFEREVYFPKGVWVSLEGTDIVKGPKKKKIKIPIDKIPIYIKQGSIIPTVPVKDNLSKKIDEIEFNIFPDKHNEFVYYEDDGVTQNYLEGMFLTQKVVVKHNKKKVFIELFPTDNFYVGYNEEIRYRLNIFADHKKSYFNEKKVKDVLVNQKKVEVHYTNNIFSGTVESKFRFLNIDLGIVNRKQKTEVQINLK